MIVITGDTEWSPIEVIDYMTDILAEYGIRATLFCTDEADKSIKGHELAIHPNFRSSIELEDFESKIRALLAIFPESVGIRPHGPMFDTRLVPIYLDCGLKYDSSFLFPNAVMPFSIFGITECPIWWMDSHACGFEKRRFTKEFITGQIHSMKTEDVCLFNIHPIHVYLNTDSLERYFAAKHCYHDPIKLWKHRNHARFGVEDCLRTILDSGVETCTIKEALENREA
jgi:hypothetical protein